MQTIKKASCCPSGEHDHAIVKKLTVFGLFKRCGIWLKRNPFKRVFKCSGNILYTYKLETRLVYCLFCARLECKMIYHRQCGKNKMTKAASDHDENAVDKRTAEVEGVHVESVEGRQDAVVPAENANLKKTGVTTTARLPMKTIMTKVRPREQTAKGVVALRLYDGENVKIDLRDVYRSQWIYRSSTANVRPLVRVSGVTEITALGMYIFNVSS